LFSLRSPRPASLDAVLERTQDIMFASPTRRSIAALQREYGLRARLELDQPWIALLHLAYQAAGHELAAKTLDFSPSSIADRWAAGMRDLASALALPALTSTASGLTYQAVTAAQQEAAPAMSAIPARSEH
jgi:NTE family protein